MHSYISTATSENTGEPLVARPEHLRQPHPVGLVLGIINMAIKFPDGPFEEGDNHITR